MSFNISTGLRNFTMTQVATAFETNSAVIAIYDGGLPTSPDNAPNGTLLGYITRNGADKAGGDPSVYALQWQETAASGQVTSDPAEPWIFKCLQPGTARYGRLVYDADSAVASQTALRIDIPVGSEINTLRMDRVDFTEAGQTANVTAFTLTQQASQDG